jgi:hypothetical protein
MLQASIRLIPKGARLDLASGCRPLAFLEEVNVDPGIQAARLLTRNHLPLISSAANEFEKY